MILWKWQCQLSKSRGTRVETSRNQRIRVEPRLNKQRLKGQGDIYWIRSIEEQLDSWKNYPKGARETTNPRTHIRTTANSQITEYGICEYFSILIKLLENIVKKFIFIYPEKNITTKWYKKCNNYKYYNNTKYCNWQMTPDTYSELLYMQLVYKKKLRSIFKGLEKPIN